MTAEPFPMKECGHMCREKFSRLCPLRGIHNTLLKRLIKAANNNLGNSRGDEARREINKCLSDPFVNKRRQERNPALQLQLELAQKLLKPPIPENERTSKHRKVR